MMAAREINKSEAEKKLEQKKEPKRTRLHDNTASTRRLYSQLVHAYRSNYLIVYTYVQNNERNIFSSLQGA